MELKSSRLGMNTFPLKVQIETDLFQELENYTGLRRLLGYITGIVKSSDCCHEAGGK